VFANTGFFGTLVCMSFCGRGSWKQVNLHGNIVMHENHWALASYRSGNTIRSAE